MDEGLVHALGRFDALSAMLVERAGFALPTDAAVAFHAAHTPRSPA